MLSEQIGRMLPRSLKDRVKERVLQACHIPWSRVGIPSPLIAQLRGRHGITLLDIGASDGEFAAQLNRFCGLQRGLFVEPQPNRCEQLRRQFPPPAFSVVCAAAADAERRVEMEVLKWDYSSSILPPKRDRPEVNAVLNLDVRELISTRAAALDQICSENDFDLEIDLLKIDVQGAEHLVLAGAEKTLERTRAVWVEVSYQPLYEGSVTVEAIVKLCRAKGFILRAISEGFRGANGELFQADALFTPLSR